MVTQKFLYFSTNFLIKKQIWLHKLYRHFNQETTMITHFLQTFLLTWLIRLTSRLALMDGPKKPEPLEIRYCRAPTQGAHSGMEINEDISLKHSTNLHYMYPSVTVYGIQPSLFTLEKTACKLSHKCRSN